MYGLVQVGIITHMFIKEHLPPFGYDPEPITHGLWCHKKIVITFTLVVDKFGVIYHKIEYS